MGRRPRPVESPMEATSVLDMSVDEEAMLKTRLMETERGHMVAEGYQRAPVEHENVGKPVRIEFKELKRKYLASYVEHSVPVKNAHRWSVRADSKTGVVFCLFPKLTIPDLKALQWVSDAAV